jgi:hypothetical protein
MLMAPPPGYSPSAMNRQMVQPFGGPPAPGMPISGGGSLGASAPYGSSLGHPVTAPMPGSSMHGPALGGMANSMNMAKALGG